MASNLEAMASNLRAMASNLEAMASTLLSSCWQVQFQWVSLLWQDPGAFTVGKKHRSSGQGMNEGQCHPIYPPSNKHGSGPPRVVEDNGLFQGTMPSTCMTLFGRVETR